MSRKEFPKAVKVAVIKRAMKDGLIRCEECHGEASKHEIDHINADGLTGTPTIDNARLLCKPCHAIKTKGDVSAIAKAKRREAAHIGAKTAPKVKIKSADFLPAEKQHKASKPLVKKEVERRPSAKFGFLERRPMFVNEDQS